MDSDFATVIASPAIASPASADRPPEGRAGDRASRKPVFSFAPHPKESYCGSSGKQQPKRGNVSATKSPSKLVSKVKSKSAHRFRVMTMESKKCTSNGFDLANASWMTAPTLLSIEFERTATKHIASVTIELTGIQFPPATPPPRAV